MIYVYPDDNHETGGQDEYDTVWLCLCSVGGKVFQHNSCFENGFIQSNSVQSVTVIHSSNSVVRHGGSLTAVFLSTVNVKWAKEKLNDIELNTDEPPLVFKAQLFALCGVQPERQKLMVKGTVIKVSFCPVLVVISTTLSHLHSVCQKQVLMVIVRIMNIYHMALALR